MIATVLEILFAALILFGVWHREKLIAFENRVIERVRERMTNRDIR